MIQKLFRVSLTHRMLCIQTRLSIFACSIFVGGCFPPVVLLLHHYAKLPALVKENDLFFYDVVIGFSGLSVSLLSMVSSDSKSHTENGILITQCI